MPERKYISEFGLNVCTNQMFLLQQDHLSEIDKIGVNTHIYMICRRPRIGLIPETVIFTKENITGQFFISKGDEKKPIDFEIRNNLGTHEVQLVCEYPFTEFAIQIESGEIILMGKSALLMTRCGTQYWKYLDLEVLYIGQSFGKEGERTSSERLKNHSTLQGIYAEALQKSPDQDIWLILSTFGETLLTSIDGRKDTYGTTSEEDDKHRSKVFKNILEDPMSLQQVINFTEAALIRYFQPPYNKIYKNSFPNPKHTSYSECYDIDLNMIMVELQTEQIGLKLYSESVEPKWIHYCEFPLHSREKRIYMFDLDQI
jgi:hypothetical protein